MTPGDIADEGCTFGKVLSERIESVQNQYLKSEEQNEKEWSKQNFRNRNLFDRAENVSKDILKTEGKLKDIIHAVDSGIRERIAKSEKKIAVIVVGGGILVIAVRILLAKVFGISI